MRSAIRPVSVRGAPDATTQPWWLATLAGTLVALALRPLLEEGLALLRGQHLAGVGQRLGEALGARLAGAPLRAMGPVPRRKADRPWRPELGARVRRDRGAVGAPSRGLAAGLCDRDGAGGARLRLQGSRSRADLRHGHARQPSV